MSNAGIFTDNAPGTIDVVTVTGNSGGAVPPDGAGNLNLLGSGNVDVSGSIGTNTLTVTANATSQVVNYTAIDNGDTPYTALSTDYYIGADVTAGVISILLPDAPSTGRIFVVKDVVGDSSTSNISVTTVGGVVTIDGVTTYTIDLDYQAIQIIWNGTTYEVF